MKSTVNNNKKARGRGEGLKRERKRRRWRGEGRKGTGDAMTEGKESSRNGTPRREESWFCQLLLPGGGGEGGGRTVAGPGVKVVYPSLHGVVLSQVASAARRLASATQGTPFTRTRGDLLCRR